jgi:hypothetical protein
VGPGLLALAALACGGRTGLRDTPDDAGVVVAFDASKPVDSGFVDSGGACSYDGDPSPSAVQSYGACGEGVNISSPPSNNCGGIIGAAFEYVPQTTITIERIELHTDAATIGLLDSDAQCDRPGKVLFLAQADSSGTTPEWRGAFVNPPISVKAQHKYFVYQAPADGMGSTMCSIATSGVEVREYTAPDSNGPWDGPFGGLAWSARLDGLCP